MKYPINFINTVSNGRSIEFTEGAYIPTGDLSKEPWFDVKIIRSSDQFQSFCKNAYDASLIPKQYDSRFFQDHALIIILVKRDGFVIPPDRVDALKINGHTLGISMTTWIHPDEAITPDVIGELLINLEVKKNDVANVSKIEVYNKNENE